MTHREEIQSQAEQAVRELAEAGRIGRGQIIVVGASTSEVLGKRIGTSGALEVAGWIFAGIEKVKREKGFFTAYQCCEHLNRALVIERESFDPRTMEEVSAVPVREAGGAMAAYAYRHFANPCLVEAIQADGGIDIGDTLIGMHLRRVAVPFRPTVRQIGQAHVTAAYTRPKLIGGERAKYKRETDLSGSSCD
jgi:uncharacterized protein (TIGR01440 family)